MTLPRTTRIDDDDMLPRMFGRAPALVGSDRLVGPQSFVLYAPLACISRPVPWILAPFQKWQDDNNWLLLRRPMFSLTMAMKCFRQRPAMPA